LPRRRKAKQERRTVRIADAIYKDAEDFLKGVVAQKNGLTSMAILVERLLINFLANYKEEYRLFQRKEGGQSSVL